MGVPRYVMTAVGALKEGLAGQFGDRLRDVRLYGSWARGDPRVGSDIDVLVLIDDYTWQESRAVAQVETEVLLRLGTALSTQVMSTREFEMLLQREVGFAQDVRDQGISV